jgi:hypothetical protein
VADLNGCRSSQDVTVKLCQDFGRVAQIKATDTTADAFTADIPSTATPMILLDIFIYPSSKDMRVATLPVSCEPLETAAPDDSRYAHHYGA